MSKLYSGAEIVFKCMEDQNVEHIFGYPGGAVLPIYDELQNFKSIKHVLVRHEQGAGHAAEGYARSSGKPGVILVTSGPGATNVVTALTDAYMDSIPLVCISGQVPTHLIGTDAFQECDTTGITRPCTKHNWLVKDVNDLAETIHKAFEVATTGRPGPVLVDIPKDILNQKVEWIEPKLVDLPGYKPTLEPNPKMINQAADLIKKAEKPILYVGGGIIHSKANEELFELATKFQIPVVTTLMGRGAFPDGNELCFEMPGMHGNYTATTSIQKSDLLIAIGVRFDDRVTANPKFFAQNAKVIHADIDPAEIGKIREPEVPIVGDAKSVITGLIERLEGSDLKTTDWINELNQMKKDYPLSYIQEEKGPLKVPFVLEELQKLSDEDAIVVSGVGQHQMWISQHWNFTQPNTWLNSGGLGTMGYSLPAAIGAQAAYPDRQILALDGDGCFQMTCQELITASTENIPIKIVVFNNGNHGMVRQWQKIFYKNRFSASELTHHTPDYVALAESMGATGLRMIEKSDVKKVFEKMLEINDKPVLVECIVDPEDMVFPMVPAGGSNDVVILNEDDLKKL